MLAHRVFSRLNTVAEIAERWAFIEGYLSDHEQSAASPAATVFKLCFDTGCWAAVALLMRRAIHADCMKKMLTPVISDCGNLILSAVVCVNPVAKKLAVGLMQNSINLREYRVLPKHVNAKKLAALDVASTQKKVATLQGIIASLQAGD